jgi:hypothetical protein
MSEAETRLADLWKATNAPPRDFAFALAVEERIARRLMFIDLAARIGASLVLLAALAVFGPALLVRGAAFVGSLDSAGPVLAAVAVLGAIMVRLTRTPGDASRDLDDGGSQTRR